jgi:hypothetical protein
MTSCLACWLHWACPRHPAPSPVVYPPPQFSAGRCLWPGCGKTIKGKSQHRQFHWSTHTGEKPYKCDFVGCSRAFAVSCNLTTHKLRHAGKKPNKCTFKDCGKAFTALYDLAAHKRTHTGEKPYKCEFEGCNKAFARVHHLHQHERTHTGERPCKCSFGGCDKAFTRLDHLHQHERTHTGEKPYKCTFENCGYTSTHSGHIKTHHKAMHTPEGAARQKRKENLMHLALKERKVVLDYGNSGSNPNLTVDLSCVGGTRAHPDFTEQGEEVLNFYECQEHHHSHYPLSCEVKRWNDIYSALRVGGETRAICFYLVNPDSYTIDGVKEKTLFRERMDAVVNLSRRNRKPEQPFTLFFCYYPVCKYPGKKDRFPEILMDPDFPEELKGCVRCIY